MSEIKKTIEMSETTEMKTPETATADGGSVAKTPIMDLKRFLAEYGGGTETLNALIELGVEQVNDLADLTAEELVGTGLKLVQARKLLKSFRTPSRKLRKLRCARRLRRWRLSIWMAFCRLCPTKALGWSR